MSNSPLVSVIMNCYNGQKFLRESLASLFSQSYKNWELIFWDNLSTDESKNILNSFYDDRIKYFSSRKFLSLYSARNHAVNKAKGKYISFLDVDDLWREDKLEIQMKYFLKNENIEIVYANHYLLYEKRNVKKIQTKSYLPEGFITNDLLKNYCVGIQTLCLNKKIFENNKFNDKYNIIGDFDFVINQSLKKKIGSIQEPLAFYRIHKDNLSKKKIDFFIKELEEWIKINENKYSLKGFSFFHQKVFLFKLKLKSLLKIMGV